MDSYKPLIYYLLLGNTTLQGQEVWEEERWRVGFLVRKNVRWHRIPVGVGEEREVKNDIECLGVESRRNKVDIA